MLKARHAATTFLLQMCLPTVPSCFTAGSLRAMASKSCRSDSSGQSTGSSDEYQLLYYSDVESNVEKQSVKIGHQQLLTDLKEEMGPNGTRKLLRSTDKTSTPPMPSKPFWPDLVCTIHSSYSNLMCDIILQRKLKWLSSFRLMIILTRDI